MRDLFAPIALGLFCFVQVLACAAPAQAIWPFSSKPATPAAPAAVVPPAAAPAQPAVAASGYPPGAQPPGTSIQQAGFQQPEANSVSKYEPAPGKSLDKVEDERPWLTRQGEKLKLENASAGFNKMIGQGPNEAAARASFAEGESAMRAGQYDEAAKKYKNAAKRWPDSLLQEDAMFMHAEALFFADRYSKAVDAYVELLKKFENSRYLDKVVTRQFAIARYWDDISKNYNGFMPNFTDKKLPMLSTRSNAVALYDTIRLNDPTGPLADDAVFACGVRHFLDARYEDADFHFNTLRKEYPRSEHMEQALALGLRAKMRSYQGPEYDEKPLLEADKLIDTTRLQTSQEATEERERLQRAQRTVRAQRAEREFNNGEYYYRRKYYGAAKFYYQEVLKTYPDPQAAELAKQRIAETQNLPDEPPDYFGWLGKIFGERDRRVVR